MSSLKPITLDHGVFALLRIQVQPVSACTKTSATQAPEDKLQLLISNALSNLSDSFLFIIAYSVLKS